MHVETSMIPHSSAAAAAAAARKKGRKCLFPACPPASSSKERERELLLHRSKTTNVHETSPKFFINMRAAFRACCIKSARDNRTLRNSGEMAAQKRIEERERVCHRQQALSPLQQTGKEDDDSTFRNMPSGSILVVRANY